MTGSFRSMLQPARRSLLAAALGFLIAGGAFAMDFAQGESVTLANGQVIRGDWYAAGKQVNLSGRVERDAFIAAQQSEIQGEIGWDLNLVSETATVRSTIHGTLRLAGRQVRIGSPVSEEALLFAQTLVLEKNTEIRQDMLAFAQHITIEGTVNGRADVAAETVDLNGTLAGDVSIRAQHINLGPQARIQGSLTYYAPRPMTVSPGAQVPKQVQWFRSRSELAWKKASGLAVAAVLFFRLGMILALLAIGIALIALAPASSQRFVQAIHDHPWPSLGWGALTLAGAPLVIVFLAATMAGIPLALVLTAVYVLSLLLAQMTAGAVVGKWIYRERAQAKPILAYVVGFLIFAALTLIPFLDFLVKLAGMMLGLGAWWVIRRQATAKPA